MGPAAYETCVQRLVFSENVQASFVASRFLVASSEYLSMQQQKCFGSRCACKSELVQCCLPCSGGQSQPLTQPIQHAVQPGVRQFGLQCLVQQFAVQAQTCSNVVRFLKQTWTAYPPNMIMSSGCPSGRRAAQWPERGRFGRSLWSLATSCCTYLLAAPPTKQCSTLRAVRGLYNWLVEARTNAYLGPPERFATA